MRDVTSQDTQKALEEQRKQLDRTLGEQRTRTLNERFATAAGQLGSDKPPAVRLAGVYAMAGLADDWPENRQTCVDVLCGYLRMPHEPEPGDETSGPERLAFRGSREVRHTAIRVITAHLKAGTAVSWQGLDLDFTGVVFDDGDFAGARFSGGTVSFIGAEFSGDWVRFDGAEFSGGEVHFDGAGFSGGEVGFDYARFSGGIVSFDGARFSGSTVSFGLAQFSGGTVRFDFAEFIGGTVSFPNAGFSSGTVSFHLAGFFDGMVSFDGAGFSGATVSFADAVFSGATVSFAGASDWSCPPAFSWTGTPPPGVVLPEKEDQSQA